MVWALSSVACSSDSDDAVGTDASPQMNGGQSMPSRLDMGGQLVMDGAVQVDAAVQADAAVPTDLGMIMNPDSSVPTDPTNCTGLCNYLEMCGSCFWITQAIASRWMDASLSASRRCPAVAECVAGLAARDGGFEGQRKCGR